MSHFSNISIIKEHDMKKILLFVVLGMFVLSGCAMTGMTTKIGIKVGTSFQAAAADGLVCAEDSIKAWPYVSGQFKGVMGEGYLQDLPKSATDLITKLDELALKVLGHEDGKCDVEGHRLNCWLGVELIIV